MMLPSVIVLLISALALSAETPPRVESKPMLLDSYLPACMQLIAYFSELMKYEIRPSAKPPTSVTTTTTIRPTPAHKPGYYQPEVPPGPQTYFARIDPYQAYIQRFRNPQGIGYFERYNVPNQEQITGEDVWAMPARMPNAEDIREGAAPAKLPKDLDLFGITTSDLLHRVNRIDDYDFEDEDDKLERFSVNYDDQVQVNLRALLRQKKVPPTRAYVTLLSLYDALNKEAKIQNFQKYGGYVDRIVQELVVTSRGSSSDQLKFVLSSYRPHVDRRNAEVMKKVDALIADLEKPDSYINDALRDLPALQFLA